MVERFNGTLKTGLRKYLAEHDHQWNRALPYILFAYRETPHITTGFSPFELMLGRRTPGRVETPMDWREERSRGRCGDLYDRHLRKASQMATATEEKAKEGMTKYYDQGARLVSYQEGDLVLVLRPSAGNKLQARWKGPYMITKKLSTTTYRIQKSKEARQAFTYHVNMLQRYHSPNAVCLMTEQEIPGDEADIPCWKEEGTVTRPTINPDLTPEQRGQMEELIGRYEKVWSTVPGCTTLTEMHIETGDAKPVSTPAYTIPHARREAAANEVRMMLDAGIIEATKSPWAAPGRLKAWIASVFATPGRTLPPPTR